MYLEKIKELSILQAKKAPIGFSGDEVYLIDQGFKGQDVVVKISKRKEVLHEGKNLCWLRQYIKVPKVYQMGQIEDLYYTIMEKLPGTMFQELFNEYTCQEVVRLYATLIKQFHAIDYQGLPYNHSLEEKMNKVKYTVAHHEAKEEYFERELRHLSGQQVYDLLLSYQSEEADLVLCHGDVCMPNIMMEGTSLSGFIDVVGIGINDYHLDIAIALRTLRYNFELYGHTFSKEYQELFLQTYGRTIDSKKITFYILLDELTNG